MKEIDKKYNVWIPLAMSVMMALGMVCGYTMNDKDEDPLIQRIKKDLNRPVFGQVEELIRFVESRYVDTVDRDELVEAGIEEILSHLDPHSLYISPEEISDINDDMNGSFRGIGIELFYIEDTINVLKIVPEGPADKAGMKPYDKIISINDKVIAGVDTIAYDEIRSRLRGKKEGDHLSIKVKRLGQEELVDLNIITGNIDVHSIDGAMMIDDNTGYIKINKFSTHTYRDFMDNYEQFYEDGMKNIIIDLRGNPGGYMPEATNILSQLFEEKGRMLVYTEGKNNQIQEYKTTGKPFFSIDKIAVLIDENSASASEIIAGAIQDWDRGIIIGRRSFGKGLVQEQYSLSNGGAIRLTVARYYTPSGRSIQRAYDDYDHYYEDFLNRFESGELFNKDSMKRDDREVYETKVLKRPVYGGGGITPDLFVAVDSLYFNTAYNEILQQIPTKVYLATAKYQSNEKAIKNYVLSEISDSFDLKEEYMDDIIAEIDAHIIQQTEGEDAMIRQQLAEDEEVNLAMKYFKGDITLERSIAKNE